MNERTNERKKERTTVCLCLYARVRSTISCVAGWLAGRHWIDEYGSIMIMYHARAAGERRVFRGCV